MLIYPSKLCFVYSMHLHAARPIPRRRFRCSFSNATRNTSHCRPVHNQKVVVGSTDQPSMGRLIGRARLRFGGPCLLRNVNWGTAVSMDRWSPSLTRSDHR